MPTSESRPGLSTLALHGARESRDADTPVVSPLVSVGQLRPGSRHRRRATLSALRQHAERRARAEAASRCSKARRPALVLASGMGATACALLALLRPGDHLLASKWIYGGTHKLLTRRVRRRWASSVTLVDPLESRGWRKKLRKHTRAVFVESPVNPTLPRARPAADQLPHAGDRPRARRGLHLRDRRSTSARSSTAPTSSSTRPRSISTAITTSSAASLLGTSDYIEEVRQKMILWGQTPDPFALLAARARAQDARRARAAAERERDEDRAVVRRPEGVHGACTTPASSRIPITRSRASMIDGFGGMLAMEARRRRRGGGAHSCAACRSSRTRRAWAAWTRSCASRASRRTRT